MLIFGLLMILNKLIGQQHFFFARLWCCEDIHHSSILKLAIEKAIQKTTSANLSSKLFQDDSNNEKNQFVGFVSSHKKGKLLTSFHIHSFVVFHTDLQQNTIVTSSLQHKITLCQICRIVYFNLCN
jgi:hypothetical protein